VIAQYPLKFASAWDDTAATGNSLFINGKDGSVTCYWAAAKE
jgi:hypothetical protein